MSNVTPEEQILWRIEEDGRKESFLRRIEDERKEEDFMELPKFFKTAIFKKQGQPTK